MQLRDPCGDLYSGENDGDEDMPSDTSFKLLCQSQPDEDDDISTGEDNAELNHMKQELIANNGLINFSREGRSQAKTKSTEIKESRKQQTPSSSSKKSHKKKVAATVIDEEKERRKIQKQIEMERKHAEKELKAATTTSAKKKKATSQKKKTPEKKKAPSSANNVKKISDKRYRAEMVIQGYLSKIAKENDSKDLSLSVFMTNPDSFGLLGMALAFRAAANDIEWNDPSDPLNLKKPWEKLELQTYPANAKERCALLKKQIELVENELDDLSKAQEKRRQLMDTAEDNVGRYFNKMMELDQHARIVPSSLKRKKKPPATSKTAKKGKKATPEVKTSPLDNAGDDPDPSPHTGINQIRTLPPTLDNDDEEESMEEVHVGREAEESIFDSDEDDEDRRLNDTALLYDLDSDDDRV